MIRRLLTIVFAVVLASGFAGVAWGEPGGKADPEGDTHLNMDVGPGHLDVVKVSHDDDGEIVTYTVRTAHQWSNADLEQIYVNLDHMDGVEQYDCQQVTAIVRPKAGGVLEGKLHQCRGSGSGPEGGPGGERNLGPVTAVHEEMTDTITISFALKSLRDVGFEDGSFRYSIQMEEAGTMRTDYVPNDYQWITHTFSAPATPLPTVAPISAPTAEPSAEPSVEPTPQPTVEPTPAPATPQPDAMSFAAPQEQTTDDGTSTPLRVAAAGSVVAGAGIALVRFWPF